MSIALKYSSTHIPLLMKLFPKTGNGDVLELGTGIYSTPFLHWACFLAKRRLISFENSDEYIDYALNFKDDFHQVYKVDSDSYNQADIIIAKWGLVFIDQFPMDDRGKQLESFAGRAEYIVLHDSELGKYDNLFKYHYDYTEAGLPYTSVFSNFKPIEL